jgi:hypothetical protein
MGRFDSSLPFKFINPKKTAMSIQHNINVAKPSFERFIKFMHPELSRWIQYCGFEIVDENKTMFIFRSSSDSLEFKVYAGIAMPDIEFDLRSGHNDIYEYFRTLKYNIIDSIYSNR